MDSMPKILIKISQEQKNYVKYECDSLKCNSLNSLCCRNYSAVITDYEADIITKLIPHIWRLHSLGPDVLPQSPYSRLGEDTLQINHSPLSGACIFLSAGSDRIPLCLIHSTCSALGLDYRLYKPLGCCVFPLEVLSDSDKETILILHRDYASLPCLTVCLQDTSKTLTEVATYELEFEEASVQIISDDPQNNL